MFGSIATFDKKNNNKFTARWKKPVVPMKEKSKNVKKVSSGTISSSTSSFDETSLNKNNSKKVFRIRDRKKMILLPNIILANFICYSRKTY